MSSTSAIMRREKRRLELANLARDPVLLLTVVLVWVAMFIFILWPLLKLMQAAFVDKGHLSAKALLSILSRPNTRRPQKQARADSAAQGNQLDVAIFQTAFECDRGGVSVSHRVPCELLFSKLDKNTRGQRCPGFRKPRILLLVKTKAYRLTANGGYSYKLNASSNATA